MTKWTTEIDDPRRVPEIVSRAFYTATAGRPGPVVVGLPRDMLDEKRRCRGRAGLRARRDRAGRGRNGAISEHSAARGTAALHPRRQPLVEAAYAAFP